MDIKRLHFLQIVLRYIQYTVTIEDLIIMMMDIAMKTGIQFREKSLMKKLKATLKLKRMSRFFFGFIIWIPISLFLVVLMNIFIKTKIYLSESTKKKKFKKKKKKRLKKM